MHICFIVIWIWLYHVAWSMFAQVGQETIITEENISINSIVDEETQESSTEEATDQVTDEAIDQTTEESAQDQIQDQTEILSWTTIEEPIFDELNDNETSLSGFESTWSIIEDPSLSTALSDNDTIQSGLELTWTIEPESTWEILLPEINNPSDIEWLQTWLDANTIESIGLSGNYVTIRKDRRWFFSKAYYTEYNKMPLLVPWVLNNHSAIYFDNIDDWLQTNIKLNSEYTLFIVYNKEHTPINFASAIWSNTNWFVWFQQNNFWFFATWLINIPSYRDWNIFKIITLQNNNSWTQVFLNNNNITSEKSAILPTQQLTLGNIWGQEALWWYIAEILVYDKSILEYEMTKIHEYFQRKYSPFTSKGLPTEKTESTEENNCDNLSNCDEEQNNEVIIQDNTEYNDSDSTGENNNEPIETTNENTTNDEANNQENLEDTQETTDEKLESDFKFARAFKKDEQDETIWKLQEFLTRYWTYQWEINKTYDNKTIDAIYKLQLKEDILKWQENNKSIHWYLWPSTRNKINELWISFANDISWEEIDTNTNSESTGNTEKISTEDTEDNKSEEDIIEEEIISISDLKEKYRQTLLSLEYQKWEKTGKELLIGKNKFSLKDSLWIIPISTVIEDDKNINWEIFFQENTIIKDKDNNNFEWEILFYDIENDQQNQDWIQRLKIFKAWADEPIFLKDENENSINANIKINLPDYSSWENIIIQYSDDWNTWNYLDTVQTKSDESWTFASFQTNHFTIFSLGIWTWSFSINNDIETTTWLNVTLTNLITWATHMRFWNTIAERDIATWTGYKTNFNWNLTGIWEDWIKWVYAQFSWNWVIRNVSDSIIYETAEIVQSSGLQLHLDWSTWGIRFYDLSYRNLLFTWVNWAYKTTQSWEDIIRLNWTSQYIENTSWFITWYPFTISAWVKVGKITWTQWIVVFWNSATTTTYYGIQMVNAKASIVSRNTTARILTAWPNLSIWKRAHIVWIFNSATSRQLYVNWISVWTNTLNWWTFSTTNPRRRVGRYPNSTTKYFSWNIDEVRVYNKALNIDEIQSLYLIPPTFDPLITSSNTPTLYGHLPSKIINVSLTIDWTTYPTTGISGNKWMTLPILTWLAAWIYDVTLNYTSVYGKTGSFVTIWWLIIKPASSTWLHIQYNTTGRTSGNIISTLTGLDPTYMIINNQWSEFYTFTWNWNFTYQYVDKVWTTWTMTATVSNIDKIVPTFNGINSWYIYSGFVNIDFYDENLSWAILSWINWTNYYSWIFQNWSNISIEWSFYFEVSDLAWNRTLAIFSIQFSPEQRSLNTLTNIWYQTWIATLTSLDPNTLIWNTNIDFALLSWNLLVPTLLQSSNTYAGRIWEIEIPAGAVLKNTWGTPFIWTLKIPNFQDPTTYSSYIGKTAISAIDVWSTNHIYFKDTENNDMEVTFRMPVPGKSAWDLIDIYTSEDWISFTYLTTVQAQDIWWNIYAVFESNHFSVVVTAGNNWTNISADKAANSTSWSAYTTLWNIVIAEWANTDFTANQTNVTVILTAPTNRKFNAWIWNIAYTVGRDITAASINVTNFTITVTFTTDANANRRDTITISNIQVQAITGNILPSAGNILRTSSNPGTANIVGITNDVTNFGSLSQIVWSHKYLFITMPWETFTAWLWNTGIPNNQRTNSWFNITAIRATDQFYNIVTSYAGTKTLTYTWVEGLFTTWVSFTTWQSTTSLYTIFTEEKTNATLSVSDWTISWPYTTWFNILLSPTAFVEYNPWSWNITTGNVIATLTWFNKTWITITNNWWSGVYIFTGNWSFIFTFQDLDWFTWVETWFVDRIRKSSINYSTWILNEDPVKNDGSITGNIIINLTWDLFTTWVISSWYYIIWWVPSWLTWVLIRDSSTQITFYMTWNATSHSNTWDTWNVYIIFTTWAFLNYNSWETINSTKTWIQIDFLDPYIGMGISPSADTMLDADTNVEWAGDCSDGKCQEMNYWATNYLCLSDFGSKVIMKFNVANSVTTWSIITSAKLRLNRYHINWWTLWTWFKLTKIINNSWWIEWTKNIAAASAWEPNYKQRKRLQENWHNGSPWLVAGVDYVNTHLLTVSWFTWNNTSTYNQEFTLNSNWVAVLQDWLDNPSTNQWFSMWDSNDWWLCTRSKEYATVWNRPLLTVTYALDTANPTITSLDPNNNETWVSINNNLYITFNENVWVNTWKNIYIRKLSDSSIFETISVASGAVSINWETAIINPINNLISNTWYYVEVESWAFLDRAWNIFSGFVWSGTWKFYTINTDQIPVVTWAYFTWVEYTWAILGWAILTTWSSNIIERWVYRSTINWFNDWAWTKVSQTWDRSNTWFFTGFVWWLPQWTNIYFKAFARNTEWNWYSMQNSFITKPPKPVFWTATKLSNESFQINWFAVTWATTYYLHVSKDSGFVTYLSWYWPKIITWQTYNYITWLANETWYYYKLIAWNNAGYSLTSDIQLTTTTKLPWPIVHLKLEETAWVVAYDSTEFNNNGIIFWSPLMNQTWADGKSFYFDGINDDINVVDFVYWLSFSVYFWFKTTNTWNNIHLFSHGSDTYASWSVNVVLDNASKSLKTYINWNQNILNLDIYTGLVDGKWHLYTLTINDDDKVPWKKQATVYIDSSPMITNSTLNSGNYSPVHNIVRWRVCDTTTGFFKWQLDDLRIFPKDLTSWEIESFYYDTADLIPPTAIITYSPDFPTTGSVIATLTWFSESWIIITNNSWSSTYTFTGNWSFTFTYVDLWWNTWSTTATVTRIWEEPLNIWWPTMINASIEATNNLQIVEQEFNDYFRVEDPMWANSWYYTTISISDLSWNYDLISKDTIYLKWTWITLLSWTYNSRVSINSGLENYQSIWSPITYIKRDPETNYWVTGRYWNKPWLRFDIPAYIRIDEYNATLTYTLYEN